MTSQPDLTDPRVCLELLYAHTRLLDAKADVHDLFRRAFAVVSAKLAELDKRNDPVDPPPSPVSPTPIAEVLSE